VNETNFFLSSFSSIKEMSQKKSRTLTTKILVWSNAVNILNLWLEIAINNNNSNNNNNNNTISVLLWFSGKKACA